MQRWNLKEIKDDSAALAFRSEIDLVVAADKLECADLNGIREQFKSNVLKVIEQTLGHKIREDY